MATNYENNAQNEEMASRPLTPEQAQLLRLIRDVDGFQFLRDPPKVNVSNEQQLEIFLRDHLDIYHVLSSEFFFKYPDNHLDFMCRMELQRAASRTSLLFDRRGNCTLNHQCGCSYCEFLKYRDAILLGLIVELGNSQLSVTQVSCIERYISASFCLYGTARPFVCSTILRFVPTSVAQGLFSATVDIGDGTKELLASFVDQFKEIVGGIKVDVKHGLSAQGFIPKFLSELPKTRSGQLSLSVLFVSLLWLRHSYPENVSVNVICALFAVYYVSTVGAELYDLVSSWIWPTAQGGVEDLVQLSCDGISLCLFSKSIKFSSLENFGETMSKADKYCTNLSKYLEKVHSFVTRLIACIAKYFGFEFMNYISAYQMEIDSIEAKVRAIIDEFSTYQYTAVPTGMSTQLQVVENLMLDLEMKLKANYADKPIRDVIQGYRRMLQPVKVAVAQLSHCPREEPVVVYVCSHPGSGKSYSQEYVTRRIAVSGMDETQLIDFETDASSHLWTYINGAKHYDGYIGQPVSVLNDCFVETDAEATESAATFLINAVGTNDYILPQAELSKKGRVRFLSKLMIINSNVKYIGASTFSSIRDKDALTRRLRNAWYQTVRPEFWLDGASTSGQDNEAFWREVDPAKVEAAIQSAGSDLPKYDIYLYYKWDVTKGAPREMRPYSLEEMVAENERILETRARQNAFKRNGDAILLKQTIAARRERLRSVKQSSDVERVVRSDSEVLRHLADVAADGPAAQVRFIRAYTAKCIEAGRRLTLEECEDIPDCQHKIFPLLSRISLWYLNSLCQCEMGDKLFFFCLHYWNKGMSFHEVLRHGCNNILSKFSDAMYYLKTKWYAWYHDHPCLGPIVEGLIGVGARFLLTYGWCSVILKFLTMYLGRALDNIVSSCPKCNGTTNYAQLCVMHQMQRDGVEIDNGVCIWTMVPVFHKHNMQVFGRCLECEEGGLCGQLRKRETPQLLNAQAQVAVADSQVIPFVDARLNNCYKVSSVRSVSEKGKNIDYQNELSHLWFLGRRYAIVNYHTFLHFVLCTKMPCTVGVTMGLSSLKTPGNTVTHLFRWDDIQVIRHMVDKDITVLKMPIYDEAPNMLKYFPSKTPALLKFLRDPETVNDITFVSKQAGMISKQRARMRYNGGGSVYTVSSSAVHHESGDTFHSSDFGIASGNIVHSESWYLDIVTSGGDCLGVGFWTDSQKARFAAVDPMLQHSLPVYWHHSASSTRVPNGGILFREDFSFLEDLGSITAPEERIATSVKQCAEIFERISDTTIDCPLTCVPAKHSFDEHHSVIGTLPSLRSSVSSRISKSPLFGIYPITRLPVKLYDEVIGGVKTNKMREARYAYGSNLRVVPSYRVSNFLSEKISAYICRDSSPIVERGLLTYEEAILGSPADHLPPIGMSTSPGVTLNLIKRLGGFNGKGKHWLFGHGENPDLTCPSALAFKKYYTFCLDKLKSGDRCPNLYGDCLKDELRQKGKTPRLFCAGDLSFLILCKQYLGKFVSWMVNNRIKNRVAVGINPYSGDWDDVYNHLTSLTPEQFNAIFGDFGKFDKKQLLAIMFCTLVLIRAYYGDVDLEANRIRELLFQDIIASLHVVNDSEAGDFSVLYRWLHGNTSGNFLTAILNSISNIFIHCFCGCAILMESQGLDIYTAPTSSIPISFFWNNTRMITYGDDVGMTVKNMPCVNFNSMQEAIRVHFDLEYTDELKTGGDIPDYRRVADCSFISRRFKLILRKGTIKILSPLKLPSIVEAPQWIRDGSSDEELYLTTCNSALEMSQHSAEEYDKFYSVVNPRCLTVFGKPLPFRSHEVALDYLLSREAPDYSGVVVPEFDYTLIPKTQFLRNRNPVSEKEIREEASPLKDNFVCVNHSDVVKQIANLNLYNSSMEEDTTGKVLCLRDDIKVTGTSQSSNVEKRIDAGAERGLSPKPSVICDNSRTTCWTEAEQVVMSHMDQPTMISDIIVRSEPIEMFLSKPLLLKQFTYDVATAPGARLFTQRVGDLLQPTNPSWNDKLKGFLLVRGTFVLRVEVNAYPFQSGLLLVHYIPNYTDIVASANPFLEKTHNTTLNSRYQHPFIELDLRDTCAEMRIPFIAPVAYFDRVANHGEWGSVFIDAVTPLGTGTAGGTSADVSVYGYFENIEIATPSVPQMANKEKRVNTRTKAKTSSKGAPKGETEPEKQESGPIEAGLRVVSNVASALGVVPVIGEIAQGVAWVTNVGASIASVFGWSKAIIDDPPVVVTRQTMRYAHCTDGTDTSVSGGITFDNRLVLSDKFSITNEDEMSLPFLLKIPSYSDTYPWTSDTPAGSTIWTQDIGPENCGGDSVVYTVGASTVRAVSGAPIYYLSTLFRQWRGDIKVRIKIVKTQYHSGRLQVTFNPGTAAKNTGLDTGLFTYRHIIDIREQSDVVFNLPYSVAQPYLLTGKYFGDSTMGRLDVVVLNELRAPETCSKAVQLVVFYYAGDNFEFQIPGPATKGTMPYYPQMANQEVLYDGGIADTPMRSLTTTHSSTCVGEHVMSVKQLLNRFSQLQPLSTVPLDLIDATQYCDVFPYLATGMTLTASGMTSPGYGGDAFSWIAPMYAFQRGTARMWMYSDMKDSGQHISAAAFANFDGGVSYGGVIKPAVSPVELTGTIVAAAPAEGITQVWPFASVHPNDAHVGILGYRVPFYSRYPVSYVQVAQGTTSLPTLGTYNVSSGMRFAVQSGTFDASTIVGRSFADDFVLSFFIGCPPVAASTT